MNTDPLWNLMERGAVNGVWSGRLREAAAQIGCSYGWVRVMSAAMGDLGAITRLRRGGLHTPAQFRLDQRPPSSPGQGAKQRWTEDMKSRLETHSASGMTTSRMAKEIGVTRNAVCGQRSRLKLPKRTSPIRR